MKSFLTTIMFVSAIALAPRLAMAQGTPRPDARWSAWLGCWTPTDAVTELTGMPTGRTICVVPAAGTSAVDMVTIAAGQIVSREHVEATGAERKTERDGCAGSERARWSADGRRVYLHSEFTCADGAMRTSSGLIAMSVKGEWLNVAGVTMGGNTGVRVLRHQAVDLTTRMPQEIVSALQGTTRATAAARVAVASAVANAEIIEASHELDAAVVEAWLSEAGQAFTANVKRLVALADAGVPDRVIDVVVALSYPRAFAIKPSPNAEGALATGGSGSFGEFSSLDAVSSCAPYSGIGPGAYRGFSLYGWDNCAMYYGYSPYAYSRYGNVPYGTWYLNSQPMVIILTPNGGSAGSHGQVTKGGYVAGSDKGTTATGNGTSTTSSGGDSGGSSGNSGGTSTTGSGTSSGDRTAHPK